jgi:hypothetical protein
VGDPVALDTLGILAALESHALKTGRFEWVSTHEPKAAPGQGLTCAIWVDRIGPARGHSGLAATTGLLVFQVRVYTNTISDPADAIDPAMVAAVDDLMRAYSGDFELDGLVRCVDLLGMAGTPLAAQAAYLAQDGRVYRVMTITLPLLVDDVWEQVP